MKAVVYTQYGSPDVLQLTEVAKPTPTDDEVLIKIEAVSVNRSDWEGLIGKPLYARIDGLLKPRRQVLGSDIAGRVELVGRNIKRFKPGDEVFGDIMAHMGGFAEYVCVREKPLVGKALRLLAVQPNLNDLVNVTELYEAGKLFPVIDRRFPLDKVPEALRYLGAGSARGKIIITIEQSDQ